jgi:hypothetical protein
MSKIAEGLTRLFEKNRIIIWYDGEQNFTQEFEELQLVDTSKCIVKGNEFALKHQILLQNPNDKFLLYAPYHKPDNEDNWLLDIELSNQVFHSDQEAMFLQELNLQYNFRNWIKRYLEFFNSKDRLNKFKLIVDLKDNEERLTSKLFQIVIGASSNGLDDLLKTYSAALISQKQDIIDKDLQRFNLFIPFWESVEAVYNYRSANQGIYDFVLEVFQKNFTPLSKNVNVNRATEVLLSGWKDARSFESTFRELASKVESDLNIISAIEPLPLDQLINEDVFECESLKR